MRVVIELKRGELPEVVLNNLYKQTQLQDSFHMNMVALVEGQPKLLNLKELIDAFISHRREVFTRRTVFELRKARERGHVLEGLAVALSNVDAVIDLIKKAPSPAEAKRGLMGRAWPSELVRTLVGNTIMEQFRPEGLSQAFGLKEDGYHLSDEQAQAILELRLQRLTGLEQDKIRDEYREVIETIRDLLDILAKPARIVKIIGEELAKLKEEFADKRKSEIVTVAEDISIEDLIAPQDMVVTFSHGGYVKSQPLADYRAQRRGGRGRMATTMKEDDFIERLFVAHSHDYLLCFSDRGRLYWLKVYEVPAGSRSSRGKPIVNMFPL
jgi:DNA gyrase subunit A